MYFHIDVGTESYTTSTTNMYHKYVPANPLSQSHVGKPKIMLVQHYEWSKKQQRSKWSNNNGQKQAKGQNTSIVVVAGAVVVAKLVAGYFTRRASPVWQTFANRQSSGTPNGVADSVAGT